MSLLEDAIMMATVAHRDQLDKSGQPYIRHPLRVMEAVSEHGELAMIVGVLHDVVEDTKTTLDEIRALFGTEVTDAVDAVSRRTAETYFNFIERSKRNRLGRIVKIHDILDNLGPARSSGLPSGLGQRYHKALAILDAVWEETKKPQPRLDRRDG